MRGFLHIWAKYSDASDGSFHPLVCHIMDVASVAVGLWQEVLRPSLRQQLSGLLQLPPELAGKWIAFWAGSHDIGKAAPGFQAQSPEAKIALGREGFDFPVARHCPHGTISTRVLAELLAQSEGWPAVPADMARQVAAAVGGHHGVFPQAAEWFNVGEDTLGGPAWGQARREMLAILAKVLGIAEQRPPSLNDQIPPAFIMALAGLTSVADWIGSNQAFFPSAGTALDIDAYTRHTKQRAIEALRDLGWTGWQGAMGEKTFAELFPHITRPHHVQRQTERLATHFASPGLVLIEAPMGEGKTEAALYLAEIWTHRLGQQGLYVALPTQATSNQMFDRVRRFLSARYPLERVNFHLLHGQALLSERYEQLRLAAVYDRDDAPGRVVAEEWFTAKKRGLLAPFGVGTIDQTLLAVLQTRHSFVRLFGLAGKTIILDEVHAYDTYMSTLLERLLEWLAVLGCSVVLLSATLPRAKRQRLLAAYAASGQACPDVPYPRIMVARSGKVESVAVEAAPDRRRRIALRWQEEARLGDDLSLAMREGGCVAIICNTVGTAQRLYRRLRDQLTPSGIEVEIFHARFLFGQRDAIEQRVLQRYGKDHPEMRPLASILVATQVIEQSLDLDFDLIITEVAPVDLVLQRAGRLHRHQRHRPLSFGEPQLWLLNPPCDATGIPDLGPSQFVYDRHVLLRSYLALKASNAIHLPEDVERLVETVYGEAMPPASSSAWETALTESFTALQKQQRLSRQIARDCLIASPYCEDDLLQQFCQQLEEDNPEVHRTLQAVTRLTEPSISVICVYRINDHLFLDAGGQDLVDLSREPTLPQARQLLRNAITLSHRGCIEALLRCNPPAAWRQFALLRHHRLVELDGTGVARLGAYVLRLDGELGVVITKSDEEGDGEP